MVFLSKKFCQLTKKQYICRLNLYVRCASAHTYVTHEPWGEITYRNEEGMTIKTRQRLFCIEGFKKHVTAIVSLIGLLLFSFYPECNAQSQSKSLDISKYAPYPFVKFTNPDAPALEPLSDEEFLDKAGKVVFVVNRFDKFTNDSLLTLLEREVLPLINSDSLRLSRVVLRGAASPEGPFPNNRMLSRRRAQTLFDFLRARLAVPVNEEAFDIETVSEDYRLLLAMMRRAGDRDADLVERLCNYHLPKDEYTILKGKLQIVHGGSLWKHLLKDYFPQLRAARIVLFFEKVPEPVQPVEPLEPIETP